MGDVHVQPEVVRTPSDASGPWDFVVVCSKAMPGTRPSTAETIRPAVAHNTAIVIIQNGIAVEEEYAALFPQNPILSGVVYLPATQTAPAVIAHKEVELLYIGTFQQMLLKRTNIQPWSLRPSSGLEVGL
jgi:2-dehydropantoate 2-reductase